MLARLCPTGSHWLEETKGKRKPKDVTHLDLDQKEGEEEEREEEEDEKEVCFPFYWDQKRIQGVPCSLEGMKTFPEVVSVGAVS